MHNARHPESAISSKDLQDLMGELKLMARGLLTLESNAHSVTPTALANSALIRAKVADLDWDSIRWESRAHFFSALARAMRHALVDHARKRAACGRCKVEVRASDDSIFQNLAAEAEERPQSFLMLDEALESLERGEPMLADILKQHYYFGYSIAEIARFHGVNEKTVDRKLDRARVLLRMLHPASRSNREKAK